MAGKRRQMNERTIIQAKMTTLDKLCPDLAKWPELWSVEHADLVIGQRILEALRPFLVNLLQQGLADKTLSRHRDHLLMLGGEIIRRTYEDPDVAKQPAYDLLMNFIEEEGGPLIWPTITESAQNAFDATCRKLYGFLNKQKHRS
jgi:hypothetical protein